MLTTNYKTKHPEVIYFVRDLSHFNFNPYSDKCIKIYIFFSTQQWQYMHKSYDLELDLLSMTTLGFKNGPTDLNNVMLLYLQMT